MARDGDIAGRRMAGGIARQSQTQMGVLGISIKQCVVDCVGIARRRVCVDCASAGLGGAEYSRGTEKSKKMQATGSRAEAIKSLLDIHLRPRRLQDNHATAGAAAWHEVIKIEPPTIQNN